MARGVHCQAHKHFSVVAEENHHLQPQSRGGRTVAANMRYLCANAHSDVHYLLDLIERHATPLVGTVAPILDVVDRVPWVELRTYGPGVRRAALEGWAKYGREFLAGEYRRHAALWMTSGQARTIAAGAPHWMPGPPSFAEAERIGVVESWISAVDRGLAKGLTL